MTDTAFETIDNFAKRSGLPPKIIRAMVKKGQLPIVPTGKCHVRICTVAALDRLRQYAEKTAEEIAMRSTASVSLSYAYKKATASTETIVGDKKKRSGRPPDAVRLARHQAEGR